MHKNTFSFQLILIQFGRRHVRTVNEFQYRLQAWNLSELSEVHLPDFAQGNLLLTDV